MFLPVPKIEYSAVMQKKEKNVFVVVVVVSPTEKFGSSVKDLWNYFLDVFYSKIIKFNFSFHFLNPSNHCQQAKCLWQLK